jgi:hypothetical protein
MSDTDIHELHSDAWPALDQLLQAAIDQHVVAIISPELRLYWVWSNRFRAVAIAEDTSAGAGPGPPWPRLTRCMSTSHVYRMTGPNSLYATPSAPLPGFRRVPGAGEVKVSGLACLRIALSAMALLAPGNF